VRVTREHRPPERPPLRVEPGDSVRVGALDDEWPAFRWCESGGVGGWVPDRHLRHVDERRAVVARAYDTTEVAADPGDDLEVLERDDESGWLRCRDAAGAEGWIPIAATVAALDANGLTLTYEDLAGGEPTLVFLHGNSSHRGIWRAVAAELGDFRRVLVDVRGHGDSDHVDPPEYDPRDEAEDLAAVVRALVHEPYVLVGHSNGALAACVFAAGDYGVAKPSALVWGDIDPHVPDWQLEFFHGAAERIGRVYATADDVAAGFLRTYPNIRRNLLGPFVADALRVVEGGFRMKLDPQAYATFSPEDLRPLLPRIACPVLILRGGASIVMTDEGLADLRAGLAQSELAVIPEASHMMVLEQPEAVAAAIRDFLGGTPGRPTNQQG
jgi:pimeloyl-ACP methyl ester carboxylesterase